MRLGNKVTLRKQKELNKIAAEVAKCNLCKKGTVGLPVPGEGNPNAKIVFVGEAPGKKEALTGQPFIGRAGAMLDKGLASIKLNREDVYITSPVKYLPKRGTPTAEQIAHGKKHLEQQLAVINPKVLVAMGRVASLALLNQDHKMTRAHGQVLQLGKQKVFLMLHPAAPLHSPKLRREFLESFKKLKKLIN